jgi:hypothetical protein
VTHLALPISGYLVREGSGNRLLLGSEGSVQRIAPFNRHVWLASGGCAEGEPSVSSGTIATSSTTGCQAGTEVLL